MANVLDVDVPEYKIEENKEKRTQMAISKKGKGQANAKLKGKEAKNEFAPFRDQLEH